jgi:hypothetical protein
VGGFGDAAGASQRWDVISPDRGWLGTVRMPERFRPVQVGTDWVLGVARDAFGVELRALRR